MTKYPIELKETVYYNVEVEAESKEDAMFIATELWAASSDPNNDFCGSGMGVEACSLSYGWSSDPVTAI